ncbi:MAG: phytanoyl-CoA dioxygenase family protein [Chloroflexota bacterium]|nr:phytanoyl-CoA dioxygenase family protein [Chloroflexota bacterium]
MVQTTERTAELWVDDGIDDPTIDLYRTDAVAAGIAGFDAITDEHITRFHERGFLVVDDAFSPAEVQSALDGLLDLIDGAYPAFTGIQFEAKAAAKLPSMAREDKQDAVRKLMSFVEHDPRLSALSDHPRLIATLVRMMGEQPALFQDQALLKPPLIGREKPWHQDNAFFTVHPEATIIGVWIALDEAVPANGCMHILPGTHRAGPVPHFQRRDWQLCDTDIDVAKVVAVPLAPGGALFFHGLLHHGTPPSRSPRRRRALQFHYKPLSVGRVSDDERLRVFGADGKGKTC